MAQLPNNRPGRFIKNEDDFRSVTPRTHGDVIEYVNEKGDKFLFNKVEVKDVIREAIDNAIDDKNIDLYTESEERINQYVTRYVNQMEQDSLNRFYDKIDEVAERIAVQTLDYRIEEEVEKRLDDKINEEVQKIVNDKLDIIIQKLKEL